MRTSLKAAAFVALFGLFSAFVLPAQAEEKAADVTGTWKWTVPGRDGATRDVFLKIKQEAGKVTGTVTGFRADSESAISDGTIKGNELAFNVVRERQDGTKMTTKYTAKVDGDTLKGTIASPGRDGGEERKREFEAKREKVKA